VAGGALLGGGGGGSAAWGLELVEHAFRAGEVWLADSRDLAPQTHVAMAALVGAPAAPGAHVEPEHYWRAFELLRDACPAPIGAVITNEQGGLASVNGWYQAARAGIPVLDCPGNGRAHPTGVMGSLNLDLEVGYQSVQACAGGRPPGMSAVVRGELASCARVIRGVSVEAGGLVAVARNPARLAHVAANGAPGAVAQAIALGRAMLAEADPERRLAAAAAVLGCGAQYVAGRLEGCELSTRGGFDIGEVRVRDARGRDWRIWFWNEYVRAEVDGAAVASFPELIATVDLASGATATTADVHAMSPGHPLGIVTAPRELLRLGATMARADLLAEVATALGRQRLP
jgi:DUF917 family protein